MSTTTTVTVTATAPVATTDNIVDVKLTYSVPPTDGSRAWQQTFIDPKTGEWGRNTGREEHDVKIENIRGKEQDYTLDNAGFQYFKRPTKVTNFADDKVVTEEYYKESIDIIKELTGASRVVLFDHTRRLRVPGQKDSGPSNRQPVNLAHVDQSSKALVDRVHRHLPAEEVPELLKHRYQVINLWRPIGVPALDWPLTLCNYRSVNPEKDTYPVALIYPDREGETLGVRHSPEHRWKYLRGMTPDEGVLIKCADSIQDGSVAVFTPHTGFQDPTTPKDAPFRASIELRALVFYD